MYAHNESWTIVTNSCFANSFQAGSARNSLCDTLKLSTLLSQALLQCATVLKYFFRPSVLFKDLVLWPGLAVYACFATWDTCVAKGVYGTNIIYRCAPDFSYQGHLRQKQVMSSCLSNTATSTIVTSYSGPYCNNVTVAKPVRGVKCH